MIGTGAGKVEGLTGADKFGGSSAKFGGSSAIFSTLLSRPKSSHRHEMVPAAILEYGAGPRLADTVPTRVLTCDDDAHTCQRASGTVNCVRTLHRGHYSDPRHF